MVTPTKWIACSALVNGWCINGFPVVPRCKATEELNWGEPPCLSEKWCARLYPETGAPSEHQVRRARELAGLKQ